MHTQVQGPKMKRWAGIFVTLLSMTVFLVSITQAAEEYAGRAVYHTVKAEKVEVGDVPDHFIAIAQHSGLGFFTKGPAAGQTATRKSVAYIDMVKGKGPFTTYIIYTFRDGSTIVHKASGQLTPADGGKTLVNEGTYEASGTGKFAGTKGKGTFKGERHVGTDPTGGDAYVVVDFTGTQ